MKTKSKTFLQAILLAMIPFMLQAQAILWGANPGEGDFDGGLNGWTVNSINPSSGDTWIWDLAGDVSNGAFAGSNYQINSPTASNGSMVFNYDFMVTDGNPMNIPNPVQTFVGELISPVIDLSAATSHGSLRLSQFIRTVGNGSGEGYPFITSVTFSDDGGQTWPDPLTDEGLAKFIDLNPTIVGNAAPTNNTIVVPIPAEYSFSPAFRIKITYAGDFYFWIVDDVQVIERQPNDVRINPFRAVAPNRRIPLSQVEPFSFLADVENLGNFEATNVDLTINIEDNNGVVYTAVENYGTLAVDSLAENVIFGSYFPEAKGNFTGTYVLTLDSTDVNPSDNTASFGFTVTDSTFAKENGYTRPIRPADSNWAGGGPFAWTYGNHFFIPNGDDHKATTAEFIISNDSESDIVGSTLNIILYKWIAPVDDWQANPGEGNYSCLFADRVIVGFSTYEVQAGDADNNFTKVPLVDYNSLLNGVELEDNTHYVLMVEYTDSQNKGNILSLGASAAIDYQATVFLSQLDGQPRMTSMLGLANNLETEDFSWVGFGLDLVPCVRLNVVHESLIPNAIVDILNDAKLNIYPSPANEDITVDMELGKTYKNASIKVVDVRGAVMMEQTYNELQNQQLTFNVGNWTNGTYFLQVTTEEGVKTQHFVVQH